MDKESKIHRIAGFEIHSLAGRFPQLSEAEQEELTADINKHGQLEPIVLYEGKILDGRNRARACETLKIEPTTKEYTGDDPRAFVVSENIKRRHLTTSQRAMLVVELEQYEHGGARNFQDANWHLETRATLAESLKVGPRSVARAKRVINSGAHEVVEAVESGKLSLGAAETNILSVAGDGVPRGGKKSTATSNSPPLGKDVVMSGDDATEPPKPSDRAFVQAGILLAGQEKIWRDVQSEHELFCHENVFQSKRNATRLLLKQIQVLCDNTKAAAQDYEVAVNGLPPIVKHVGRQQKHKGRKP